MKKFLIMMVIAFSAVAAKAQVYLGGEFGVWYDDDSEKTTLTIAPSVGYELSEKWAIGGELMYQFKSDAYNKLAVAPYARYSFYNNELVRLFVDMGFGVGVVKPDEGDSETAWRIGAQPGIAIHLNKHFSILAKAGFVGYDDSFSKAGKGFGLEMSGENLSFGVEYTF